MPEVKCAVANCAYWGQGNSCNADKILIEVDQHAHAKFDAEFSDEFENHKDAASDVRNTCCHTFKGKK